MFNCFFPTSFDGKRKSFYIDYTISDVLRAKKRSHKGNQRAER